MKKRQFPYIDLIYKFGLEFLKHIGNLPLPLQNAKLVHIS